MCCVLGRLEKRQAVKHASLVATRLAWGNRGVRSITSRFGPGESGIPTSVTARVLSYRGCPIRIWLMLLLFEVGTGENSRHDMRSLVVG